MLIAPLNSLENTCITLYLVIFETYIVIETELNKK